MLGSCLTAGGTTGGYPHCCEEEGAVVWMSVESIGYEVFRESLIVMQGSSWVERSSEKVE